MLRAGFKMFSKPIKLMIYHAYISSHLYYCAEVCGNVCNTHLNHPLILQKCALRSVLNAHKLDHTASIAHSLSLLLIHDIDKFKCASLIHSVLHRMSNMSLTYDFRYVNEHINHNLRYKDNINKIMSRINVRKESFVNPARMLWNELVFDIRTVSGYRCFQSN